MASPEWQQCLGVGVYLFIFLSLVWAWPLMLALLFFPVTMIPALVYLGYIIGSDYGTAVLQGYTKKPVTRLPFWRWAAEYFNYRLVKTADLPPDRAYLLCCAPHGIFSFGAAISSSAVGFESVFAGLDVRGCTLKFNFSLPFAREFFRAWGAVDCSVSTLTRVLNRGSGSSIILEPGGTQESLYAGMGTYDIVIKRRKGFVRVALASGASLVPVFFFGETDTFVTHKAAPGSLQGKLQKLFMRLGGYTLPSFSGRLGPFPHRCNITGVVGAPIHVQKYPGDLRGEEGQALVEKYHKQYMEAVQQLWDEHKDKYAKNRKGELRFVE